QTADARLSRIRPGPRGAGRHGPPGVTQVRSRPFYPGVHAGATPDKAAVIFGPTGAVVTYRQLEERSSRLAHLFRSTAVRPGDHVAMLLDNSERFHEVAWGAQRSGLYYTPVNPQLA